jgi:hypothetical protein
MNTEECNSSTDTKESITLDKTFDLGLNFHYDIGIGIFQSLWRLKFDLFGPARIIYLESRPVLNRYPKRRGSDCPCASFWNQSHWRPRLLLGQRKDVAVSLRQSLDWGGVPYLDLMPIVIGQFRQVDNRSIGLFCILSLDWTSLTRLGTLYGVPLYIFGRIFSRTAWLGCVFSWKMHSTNYFPFKIKSRAPP